MHNQCSRYSYSDLWGQSVFDTAIHRGQSVFDTAIHRAQSVFQTAIHGGQSH